MAEKKDLMEELNLSQKDDPVLDGVAKIASHVVDSERRTKIGFIKQGFARFCLVTGKQSPHEIENIGQQKSEKNVFH